MRLLEDLHAALGRRALTDRAYWSDAGDACLFSDVDAAVDDVLPPHPGMANFGDLIRRMKDLAFAVHVNSNGSARASHPLFRRGSPNTIRRLVNLAARSARVPAGSSAEEGSPRRRETRTRRQSSGATPKSGAGGRGVLSALQGSALEASPSAINSVKGEIHHVLTLLRRNRRWAPASRFLHEVPVQLESGLVLSFKALHSVLQACDDLALLDARAILAPFLDVIASRDTRCVPPDAAAVAGASRAALAAAP